MENEATSSVVDKKFEAHEFDVKFSEEDSWKKRYLIIKGSVLFLFSNRFVTVGLFRKTTFGPVWNCTGQLLNF